MLDYKTLTLMNKESEQEEFDLAIDDITGEILDSKIY